MGSFHDREARQSFSDLQYKIGIPKTEHIFRIRHICHR